MNSQQPFSPGSQVVAYVRYSGGVEQGLKDRSTTEQTHEIQQFCDKNDLILYRVFEDAGISGTSTKGRDAFFEMINYLKSRPKPDVAGVIIWSLSRFARDLNTAQLYKADLRRLGYTIFSLTEQFEDSATGILFETLIDWKNQMYSEETGAHVARSLHANFEQFKVLPGLPPRGLMRIPVELPPKKDGSKRIGHRWELDPVTAPMIQRAFQMKADGAHNFEIKKILPFYKSDASLFDLFKRRIYYGSMTYGGITIDDYCQPAITKTLWDQVQEVCMKEKRQTARAGKFSTANIRLLSGLLICPQCSRKMFVCRRTTKGKEYSSYRCSSCSGQTYPCGKVEDAVMAQVQSEILIEKNIDMMIALYREELNATKPKQKGKAPDYSAQLVTVTSKIERVAEAIAEMGANEPLRKKLEDLQMQQQLIREKQSEHLAFTATGNEVISNAKENSLSIMDIIKDKNAPLDIQRDALMLFIKEIVPTSKTSALIRYHLPEGNLPTQDYPAGGGGCASNSVPPHRRGQYAQLITESLVTW